jgi:hypothetical protein
VKNAENTIVNSTEIRRPFAEKERGLKILSHTQIHWEDNKIWRSIQNAEEKIRIRWKKKHGKGRGKR